MSLSRLQNFLKSTKGNVIYVDPNGLDSTDNVSNSGNSLSRPFKSIQRALIESARFSYQSGLGNDRFNKTTIIIFPGEYNIDNRPGYIIESKNSFYLRSGETTSSLPEWNNITNFDIDDDDNDLYKLNSVFGGVIIPRGTSIIGIDLRKTIIRPKYVPNPENDQIESSCIFRLTGGCYTREFSVLDANPNSFIYKDYTRNKFAPLFSHHKLRLFEFADGVNPVEINDDFLTFTSSETDLDMYYNKVALIYGPSSGREIETDTIDISEIDLEPTVNEYRIVGSRGDVVGITSIRAGDGVTSTSTITVTLEDEVEILSIDTPIQITGVNSSGYDGKYFISSVISPTEFQYRSTITPVVPLPSPATATFNISINTVSSASPYIKSVSLRSIYGMSGLLGDGNKSDGFKSIVSAEFTGISLQIDDNAYVKFDSFTGEYIDSLSVANLHSDPDAKYKPSYSNFHITAKNDAYMQLVSVFGIGYSKQFNTESGGDISVTNSTSNFGENALTSQGFKNNAFSKDDTAYLTHIISPKTRENISKNITYSSIDVGLTTSISAGAATTDKLYLYEKTNSSDLPNYSIDGYQIGAKLNDVLFDEIAITGITSIYSSKIVMPPVNGNRYSAKKIYRVDTKNNGLENAITSNIINFTSNHDFTSGESVKVYSNNGHLPDGINNDSLYYVITSDVSVGLGQTQIKLAQSISDAFNDNELTINSKGEKIDVVSRVVDKIPGDIGHPIQYDILNNNWYINVDPTQNTIYDCINTNGVGIIGEATPSTYFNRLISKRNVEDSIYKIRYVVPKDSQISGRYPQENFILQESNDTILSVNELTKYFGLTAADLDNSNDLRNPKYISNISWSSDVVSVKTELNHNVVVGSIVEIVNVSSTNNAIALSNKGFNGKFEVISVLNTREFTYSLIVDPGEFTSNTTVRDLNLPYIKIKELSNTFKIYNVNTVKEYIPNQQDGVYHLTLIENSITPTTPPFQNIKVSQNTKYLYPRTDRNNPKSDVLSTRSFAKANPIGDVVVDDCEGSLTKESTHKLFSDFNIGIGITQIISSDIGIAHTISTKYPHNFNGITELSIANGGANYIQGIYYGVDLIGYGGSITGNYGSARIEVNGSGIVTSIQVMSQGCSYGIGNTVQAIPAAGLGTTTGFVPATLTVNNITNNSNNVIQIDGVDKDYAAYNTLYNLDSVVDEKTLIVSSASTINSGITTIYSDSLKNTILLNNGNRLNVSIFNYNELTGLCNIGFTTSHGLSINNSLLISGVDSEFFNDNVYVNRIISLTNIEVNYGLGGVGLTTTGNIKAYRNRYNSNKGNISNIDENLSGRQSFNYSGVQSYLITTITNISITDEIEITNALNNGFRLGDYIQINDEIFRIKSTVVGDTVEVFRGILGSKRQTHQSGSVVYKINVIPVELRKSSYTNSSAHTFEYVGYGPGNYSTAFPERQTKQLSETEVLLSQSTQLNGGLVDYTGKNNLGHQYTGNKRVILSTGKQVVYNQPEETYIGEENNTSSIESIGSNSIEADKAIINNSLQVIGGPNNNEISIFDSPVLFNKKITTNSADGIEAKNIFINGEENTSRKYTIGEAAPSISGNYGDVIFNSEPKLNSNIGWTYTTDGNWEKFGWISDNLYGVGVGTDNGFVGFSSLINFVGLGITITVDYDDSSGISTVRFSGNPEDTIGIYTGSSSSTIFTGDAADIKFIASNDGFDLNVYTQYDALTGFTTVTIENPLRNINFENILGKESPKFTTRSDGTRIVYYDNLASDSVDYAVGIGANDSLWFSVPKNDGAYAFRWFGGETEIASLISNGDFTTIGVQRSSRFISTTTTAEPLSVASSIKSVNFNADYLDGYDSSLINTPYTVVIRNEDGFIDSYTTGMVDSQGIGRSGGWFENPVNTLGFIPFNKAGDVSVGVCTFYQISDVINSTTFGSGVLNTDFTVGPIRYVETNTITTLNIQNVPTTNDRAFNYTVVMTASSTASLPSSFQINNQTVGVQWLNGISPNGTAAGKYFFGFTILRVDNSWDVLGVFANYT